MSSALSVSSPFVETDWDRRLDTMLADLESGSGSTNPVQQYSSSQQFSSQQSYSYSTQQISQSSSKQVIHSNQQQIIQQKNTQRQQQEQIQSQQSNQSTSGSKRIPVQQFGGFSLNKSASNVSLQDSAGGVLKDLEHGLLKSSNYIQESHKIYSGPEGTREWHEVRTEKDPGEFNLEQQVQHMMPGIHAAEPSKAAYQQQHQQHQQQQFTTYKVQSNQYTSTGERIQGGEKDEDDERPGSRLKQNIDELDTLLYDLNNARNLSPEAGADYTVSSENFGLDSDDYSETVGKEGHVKRTVHAFNEYSTHMSHPDVAKKPPSPSPKRKTANSPPSARRGAPTQTRTQQNSHSYRVDETRSQDYYQPAAGQPGSGQPFTYTESPPLSQSPDLSQPNYYTKYNSVRQTTNKSQDIQSVPFPTHPTRSPTPQNPPKRIDELMSEFQEFDSVNKGGSPTPAMFCKPSNQTLEVTELPDGPPVHVRVDPVPLIREPSPPRSKPSNGPKVYYPPGAEFGKSEPPAKSTVDGGPVSLEKEGKGKVRREKYDRADDGENKQGAAVIPICLPLCCAAPCVIL